MNAPADALPDYVDRVDLHTGAVLPGSIDPEELLVRTHRDYHVVDLYLRWALTKLAEVTGDDEAVREIGAGLRHLGHGVADWIGDAVGRDGDDVAAKLFGLHDREHAFRFRHVGERSVPLAELQARAAERLEQAQADGGVRVLLTGVTGFVGQELLVQALDDDGIAELFLLIRPKVVEDRATGAQTTLTPEHRGAELLDVLGLKDHPRAGICRFVAGDVEQPLLGLSNADLAELQDRATHVIHCAASVAFDDPFDASFSANVVGSRRALELSRQLDEGPTFVAHLSIETAYIHGRQLHPAHEDKLEFPRHYYNNHYELTKAMASLEAERAAADGLPLVQLCPSSVIGHHQTGNNRGDTKVINAPVNVFGRAAEAAEGPIQARLLARLACVFPGDGSAELNLVPVDRVAAGILAALHRPDAVGERVHLATDDLISAQQLRDIVQEELGVDVRLTSPALHRRVGLPALTAALKGAGQPRLADALHRLGTVFGGYSERGQPQHAVGRDRTLLGLPERPATLPTFRMLCRHNRWVQHFGQVRDRREIARREALWARGVQAIEAQSLRRAGELGPKEFEAAMRRHIDLDSFA